MKSLLLFAISFLCFSPLCFTQAVWPGDVNNNGIVNEVDFLYLSFAFNAEGPARLNTSTDWEAQELPTEWIGTYPNGLNFAFADCNGDGVVNEKDADVIELNLDTTHSDVPFILDEIVTSTSDADARFSLITPNLSVAPGETIEFRIDLGELERPVPNILGYAFTIGMDPRFIKTDRTRFEIEEVTWLTLEGESTSRVFSNEAAGKVTASVIRTDNQTDGGSGKIGTVSFVIIEDIVDLLIKEENVNDTVRVVIDSITVITDDLERIPIKGVSVDLDIIGRITSTYNPILDKIKFYPNPNNGWLLLKSKEVALEKVELVNTLGQIVYQKPLTNSTFQSLDLQHIPEGMYWLRIITELGTKSTPIQRL